MQAKHRCTYYQIHPVKIVHFIQLSFSKVLVLIIFSFFSSNNLTFTNSGLKKDRYPNDLSLRQRPSLYLRSD